MLEYFQWHDKCTEEVVLQRRFLLKHPLPNLHLGATCENQEMADKRIPILLQIPAAVRFVSVEPMLSSMKLESFLLPQFEHITGLYLGKAPTHIKPDWVIIGCESGPKRRECKIEWIEDLANQCKTAGVAVFIKQIPINGRVSKKMSEWPEDLQVREWPK
jgi:protein gp37